MQTSRLEALKSGVTVQRGILYEGSTNSLERCSGDVRARGRKWYRKASIMPRLVLCSDNKDGDVIIITTIIIISQHGKHTCFPGIVTSESLT